MRGLLVCLAVLVFTMVMAVPAGADDGGHLLPEAGVHLGYDSILLPDEGEEPLGAGALSSPAITAALGGYNLMLSELGIRDSYTIRIVTDHPSWPSLQSPVQTAAQQLSAITGASYTVGPLVGSGPSSDGEIVVSFSSGSRCGTLGCATQNWKRASSGDPPLISRSTVWINPSLVGNPGMLLQIVLHELGHSAGLDHYVPNFEGARQIMYPVAHEDDQIHTYRSGDRNGLNVLASNGFRQRCPLVDFEDVFISNPFCADIAWLVAEGIATGFGDGNFRPGANLTRQAMAAFLYRLAGEPILPFGLLPSFPDVTGINSFLTPITWMALNEISTGFGDGTFRPGANLTRQAMAAFLYRLSELDQ